MKSRPFDQFRTSYVDVHNRNLPLGLKSDEFVEQKVRFVVSGLNRWGFQSSSVRVLDFGCGHGRVFERLWKTGSFATYTGVDESTETLEEAALMLQHGHFQRQEHVRFVPQLEAIPFSDRQFELILLFNVLHHVDPTERVSLIRSLSKFLAPNGRVVVFEHNPLNPASQWIVRTCPFDKDVSLLFSSETRSLFESNGFLSTEHDFINLIPPRLARIPIFGRVERTLCRLPLGAQYRAVFSKTV